MYALSLGHIVIRALMFEAARPANLGVDCLSFTGCWQILQCRLPECDTRTEETFITWYEDPLSDMRQQNIGPSRNRISPRVIKRKMSKWNKKRPHHRRLRPLMKHFDE
ncbi:MAG: hypothetical protein ACKV2Q_27265 [Planctomycetaceae bacterium]